MELGFVLPGVKNAGLGSQVVLNRKSESSVSFMEELDLKENL